LRVSEPAVPIDAEASTKQLFEQAHELITGLWNLRAYLIESDQIEIRSAIGMASLPGRMSTNLLPLGQ
jgi:hypothetical protein